MEYMSNEIGLEILDKAKEWFRNIIAVNHIANTRKLKKSSEFNINPFLAIYLANFLTGNSSAKSIAKALIYPRILGTSITTSFGTNIQKFTNDVLDAFGSTTPGIDIEFVDRIDGHKKYCQDRTRLIKMMSRRSLDIFRQQLDSLEPIISESV
jgi:hypothetical protein